MEISIQLFRTGTEEKLSELIKEVYDEFVAADYSHSGNSHFYEWIRPENIAKRQEAQNNIYVAFAGGELAGMLETRDNQQISLLFVKKEFQNKGIAKRLLTKAVETCKERKPAIEEIYVHASPFSIPVYQKFGFIETSPMKEENGIIYLPMKLPLANMTIITA